MTIERPKVSVCMAAFQGERYVAAQLQSILIQLSDNDEVIVVDDHSSDKTCDEVRSLGDGRIRLIERPMNQGVAKSFEEALSYATGSVIFLSDQDDLWAHGKVPIVLRAFESNPRVTLVVTDATLIDEDGNRLGNSYYAWRGQFSSGVWSNLVRCKFLGCTMAFRSELVAKVLPFPHQFAVLHDIWIGVVNAITSGSTLYIDEPLVRYRRHSRSFTAGRLNRMHQLHTRLHLLYTVVNYWIRDRLFHRVGAQNVR
jgi:glycosyltransferase involved in cell wall biosynthesis